MITESLQLVYLEKTGQKILSILASNSETSSSMVDALIVSRFGWKRQLNQM